MFPKKKIISKWLPVRFGLLKAIVRKSLFMHKMLDVKGLFSFHSPNLLQCGEPQSWLDASLSLGVDRFQNFRFRFGSVPKFSVSVRFGSY